MKNKKLFAFTVFTLVYFQFYAQTDIKYIGSKEELPFHLVKYEGNRAYFVASNFVDAGIPGSKMYKMEDDELSQVTFVLHLDDSLICNQIFNFWPNSEQLVFLGYASNQNNTNNYVVLGSIQIETANITLLDIKRIEKFRVGSSIVFKDLKVAEVNHHIILEHGQTGTKPIAILDIAVVGNSLEIRRAATPNEISDNLLLDYYYDSYNKKYIVNIGKFIFALTESFEIEKVKEYRVNYSNIVWVGPWRLMLGQDDNKYIIYENFTNSPNVNRPLFKRELELTDTFYFADTVIPVNIEEDCYLVRKLSKNKYNYLFYSRSTINGFDENYGFTIWISDKKGNIVKTFDIKLERPTLLIDIDINEDLEIAFGAIQYWDNFDIEVFTFNLNGLMSGVNNFSVKKQNQSLVFNAFNSGLLYFNTELKPGGSFKVFDIHGKMVFQTIAEEKIDISFLPSGAYIVYYLIDDYHGMQKLILLHE